MSSLRLSQAPCISTRLLPRRTHRLYSTIKDRPVTTDDGTRTYRLRAGSNRPLPLPPLMDPIAISAKQRYKEPKLKPNHRRFTPFQQKLQHNPYAHILATPPRMCSLTETRLPHFFHLDLYPKPHPETGELWLVPSPLVPSATSRNGIPVRVLGRRDVLDYVAPSIKIRRHLLSPSLLEKLKPHVKDLGWRQDMSALTLSLLRKTLLQKLRWPFQHANAKLVVAAPSGTAELNDHDDLGCVLYMRPFYRPEVREMQRKVSKEAEWTDQNIVNMIAKIEGLPVKLGTKLKDYEANAHLKLAAPWMATPREFPTIEWRGGRVPVYSLADLLGGEQMKELVTGTTFEGMDWAVLKRSPLTVQMQMWLLKLQWFIAEERA